MRRELERGFRVSQSNTLLSDLHQACAKIISLRGTRDLQKHGQNVASHDEKLQNSVRRKYGVVGGTSARTAPHQRKPQSMVGQGGVIAEHVAALSFHCVRFSDRIIVTVSVGGGSCWGTDSRGWTYRCHGC